MKKGSALLRNPFVLLRVTNIFSSLHNTASATRLEKYDDDVNVNCFSFSEANVWIYMDINQFFLIILQFSLLNGVPGYQKASLV